MSASREYAYTPMCCNVRSASFPASARSRRNGIGAREKYMARPSSAITTLTRLAVSRISAHGPLSDKRLVSLNVYNRVVAPEPLLGSDFRHPFRTRGVLPARHDTFS